MYKIVNAARLSLYPPSYALYIRSHLLEREKIKKKLSRAKYENYFSWKMHVISILANYNIKYANK